MRRFVVLCRAAELSAGRGSRDPRLCSEERGGADACHLALRIAYECRVLLRFMAIWLAHDVTIDIPEVLVQSKR